MLSSGLYGILQGALLWYRLLTSKLKSFGFKLNPCNLCIANVNINGKQCSIVFYVDNNKTAHEDSKVADRVIKMIEDKFGKIVIKRGNKHNFLGIKITYNNDGRVNFDMQEYLAKAIELSDEDLKSVTKPTKNELFEYKEDSLLVHKERRKKFHSIVMLL